MGNPCLNKTSIHVWGDVRDFNKYTNIEHEHKCRPASGFVWLIPLKAPVDTSQYRCNFQRRTLLLGRPCNWQRWTLWCCPTSSIWLTVGEGWRPQHNVGVTPPSHWPPPWLGPRSLVHLQPEYISRYWCLSKKIDFEKNSQQKLWLIESIDYELNIYCKHSMTNGFIKISHNISK